MKPRKHGEKVQNWHRPLGQNQLRQRTWITGSFAKVCCRVDSQEELVEIHDKAVEVGLEVQLITDTGKTEFHGDPTKACLAIGPDDAEKIDAITGHLDLL